MVSLLASVSSLKRAANEFEFVRRRRVPAVVVVAGVSATFPTHLKDYPRSGDTLDVGFPVVVTTVKPVAGGGLLVEARIEPS